jgi:D-alanyl-D-alanine carboxypeptidase
VIGVLVIGVLTLLGAACGDDEVPRTPEPEPSPPPVAATSTATPAAEPPPAQPTPSPPACVAPAGDEILRVVDKTHPLPSDYVPDARAAIPELRLVPGAASSAELREDALGALLALLNEASAAGQELRVRSAYRSYAEQERTFQYWVGLLGEQQAARESARAGHSEHQLGTTVDLASESVGWELIPEFGGTPEGRWLSEHASRFGFALSYPPGAEEITGYVFEPWHYRYIGTDCAEQWARSDETLVEFLRGLGGDQAAR